MTRTIKYYLMGLAFCLFHFALIAKQSKPNDEGNRTIDSLLAQLKNSKEDTISVNILNNLFLEYEFTDDEKAKEYLNNAFNLSQKINYKRGLAGTYVFLGYFAEDKGNYQEALKYYFASLKIIKEIGDKQGFASAYNNIGNVYYSQGNYPDALKNHLASLKIKKGIGEKKTIAISYNNIGSVFSAMGNYPEALKNHLASLKIRETIGDKIEIAASFNNIGNVYMLQDNYSEALKNYLASLKIREVLGDKKGIASSFGNIGTVYSSQGNYQEALKNHFASLKIDETIGNKKGIGASLNNIGDVYFNQGNYPEALGNYLASLKIKEIIGDKAGITSSYASIGNVFIKQKKYREADGYLIKAKMLSIEIGNKENLRDDYRLLSVLDSAKGNFKEAYENHKLYIIYRDSMDNEETRKKTIQSQMTYDFEKKEAVANAEHKKELENQQVLAEEKSRKQKIVIMFVLIGLLLVIVFAVFIFRSLRLTRKQKQIIEIKSKETEQQKLIIEEKNKDITDSINYAKRIQQAKLPNKEDIYLSLPQSFVLFKPKDIVSGDFYFFHKNENSVFIAAADCTGHGVPGAFMSMIGSEKLNDAVSQSTDTSEILKLLNKGIKTSLRQTDSNESSKDGMDIALCSVDTKNHIVKYAGANRPIWIFRSGQTCIEEIKETKNAIGGFTDDNQHFDSHEIKLQKDDTFYIFSDGYADTFSGQTGKKLTTKKFKEILLTIQEMSMREQEKYLENFIENWKAGTEQVDDILVIGVRL